MSDVITAAEAHVPTTLDADLEAKPLAQALREATWGSHERAEYSPFETALVKGNLKKEAYADLLAQTWYVYKALEEVALLIAEDPIAGQVIFPELTRLPAVQADLVFYLGEDWADKVDILGVTEDYCDRIRKIAANDPIRYVAHHYTRYLADLSGGFMIDRGITKAYGLDVDGRRYYIFDQIENAKAFKENYRDVLNNMDIDLDTKRALVEETLVAYEFNVEMIRLLTERHDPILIDPTDTAAPAAPAGHGHGHPHA